MDLKELERIWDVPTYLPYVQPPLTEQIVRHAESEIGYPLPKEYIDILKIQNGGCIRYSLPDGLHTCIAGIGPHFPSLTDFEGFLEYAEYMSFDLKGLIPFDGDGHWNLCLDYRRNKLEPEITYVFTESDREEKLATSFRDYLAMLSLKTKGIYVLETESSLERTVQDLSQLTGIRFGEPDSFAQGYLQYSGTFNDSRIWVSANRVPSGFVRQEDERYEELRHLMDTTALRYPELSENVMLVEAVEEKAIERLIANLRDRGLRVRSLASCL